MSSGLVRWKQAAELTRRQPNISTRKVWNLGQERDFILAFDDDDDFCFVLLFCLFVYWLLYWLACLFVCLFVCILLFI